MVTRYGFSDRLGPIVYGHEDSEVFLGRDYASGRNYSEAVASEIDEDVRHIISIAYDKAQSLLEENTALLHKIAEYLLVHEKLDGETFEKIMKGEFSEEKTAASENSENLDTNEQSDYKNPDIFS